MVTDKAIILQTALSGRMVQSGKTAIGPESGGEDAAAFLKALLQQLQVDPQTSIDGAAGTDEPDELDGDGNSLETTGKLLPNTDRQQEQADGSGMASEPLVMMVAQLVQNPMQTTADTVSPSSQSESAPAPDDVILADPGAAMSAQGLEDIDLSLPVGARGMKISDAAVSGHRFPEMDNSSVAAGTIPPADQATGGASRVLRASADAPEGDTSGPDFLGVLEKAEADVSSAVNAPEDGVPGVKAGPETASMPQPQANAPSARQPVPSMERSVGQPGWSHDLGERVIWMTGQGLNSAELKLNPAHLGPLEVRIHLNQDQANVQFVSHSAAVREAIESAIPKLREMLGAQQLHLTDVSVSQQSFAGQNDSRNAQFAFQQQSQSGREGLGSATSEVAPVYPESESTERQAGRGLLNLYA